MVEFKFRISGPRASIIMLTGSFVCDIIYMSYFTHRVMCTSFISHFQVMSFVPNVINFNCVNLQTM